MNELDKRRMNMSSAWWVCEDCGDEWSAMLGDNEVPERCECGGKIKEENSND